MLHALLAAAITTIAPAGPGPGAKTGFDQEYLTRTVTIGANSYNYRVYLPPHHDRRKRYPVILFLHGSGRRGSDNIEQLTEGLPLVTRIGTRLGVQAFSQFIAVYPQCRAEAFWVGDNADQAVGALDQTVKEFNGDADRLYLTGFSLGGYGTWYLAAKYPGKFAAIVPIAGNVRPAFLTIPMKFPPPIRSTMHPDMAALYESPDPYAAFAKAIGDVPVWMFQGSEDEQVPIDDSRLAAAALKAAGAHARYTEYPGDRHYMYEKAYTEPGFWEWLMSKRLSARKVR